jgi:3-dehydrosphinganine reductase
MTAYKNFFKGKVALITGGSSGIGQALARLLATQDATVWLLARHKDRLAAAQSEVGPACQIVSADVSDSRQVQQAVDTVIRESGLPDFLFNSAGITHPGYVQDLDLEIFRSMVDVDYMGTVHMVKALLPGMLERGTGHIINISSGAGFIGLFGYSAYGASKYAVRGFSDVLRAELKPLGLRVSVVFPSDTDTPQLAYEERFKPPETKIIDGNARVMSAEAVARSILSGVKHGRYIILPGFDIKIIFHLSNLLGMGFYPVMDWMVADARRKAGKA